MIRASMEALKLAAALGTGPLATSANQFSSPPATTRSTGRTADMNAIPVRFMPNLAKQQRILAAEVELEFDVITAQQEASRCYLCHYKFEIIDAKCILCDECVNVKPVDAITIQKAIGQCSGHRAMGQWP